MRYLLFVFTFLLAMPSFGALTCAVGSSSCKTEAVLFIPINNMIKVARSVFPKSLSYLN